MNQFTYRNSLVRLLTMISSVVLILVMCSCTSLDEPQSNNQKDTNNASSNFINVNEAVANAESYFSEIFGNQTRGNRSIQDIELLNVKNTRSNTEQFGYYVINYNNEMGFALVSADRRRNPVYALSDEGSLHLSDTLTNEGLNWYINDFLSEQIIPDSKIIDIDTTKNFFQGDKIYERITCPPLLKDFMSKFHQRSPYNKYCFTSNNEQAVVGCVPIALGTFIAYNKWPEQIEGYRFYWNEMYLNKNHDGWSRLFEVIGRKEYLNATYGKESTGAYTWNSVGVLLTLGYYNVNYLQFSDNTVINELTNNRLVIVRGTSGSGHAWILDGVLSKTTELYIPSQEAGYPVYKYEKFYHCIWGWRGSGNGFYLYNFGLGGNAYKYDDDASGLTPSIYKDLDIVVGTKP